MSEFIEQVRPITIREMREMVMREHYSKTMPRLTKLCLGGFTGGELVAAMSLGWGVRPLHTIRKLFPTLTAEDYWENGRMALLDAMPRNSESQFISLACKFIKREFPRIKLLFSWSDGMLGKPGYVYQASGFMYGGYSWTDCYFTDKGEKVHPRQTNRIGGRTAAQGMGWRHYRGKQFRYVRFLCGANERKRLIKASTEEWSWHGPKHADLAWMVKDGGRWVQCGIPEFVSGEAGFSSQENHLQRALL